MHHGIDWFPVFLSPSLPPLTHTQTLSEEGRVKKRTSEKSSLRPLRIKVRESSNVYSTLDERNGVGKEVTSYKSFIVIKQGNAWALHQEAKLGCGSEEVGLLDWHSWHPRFNTSTENKPNSGILFGPCRYKLNGKVFASHAWSSGVINS